MPCKTKYSLENKKAMETKKTLHAARLDVRPFKMFKTSIAKIQKLTKEKRFKGTPCHISSAVQIP